MSFENFNEFFWCEIVKICMCFRGDCEEESWVFPKINHNWYYDDNKIGANYTENQFGAKNKEKLFSFGFLAVQVALLHLRHWFSKHLNQIYAFKLLQAELEVKEANITLKAKWSKIMMASAKLKQPEIFEKHKICILQPDYLWNIFLLLMKVWEAEKQKTCKRNESVQKVLQYVHTKKRCGAWLVNCAWKKAIFHYMNWNVKAFNSI